MKFLLFLCITAVVALTSLFAVAQPQFPLEMNDVSVLLPLPKNESEIQKLIGINTVANFGTIITEGVWSKIPTLRSGIPQNDIREELHAIALRFDPCFREGLHIDNMPCRPQIRLVMQPVYYDKELKKITTRDTALHLFYEMPIQNLITTIEKTQALSKNARSLFEGQALSVHPLIAAVGLNSAEYQQFVSAILEQIGSSRLVRVTFMTVAGLDVQWTFGGYDVQSTNISDIQIPGVRKLRQTITSNTVFPVPMESAIVPVSNATDTLVAFAHGTDILHSDELKQTQLMQKLHRVENPNFHNPATVDCVSCHITLMAKAWSVENQLPQSLASKFSFKSLLNIENESTANARKSVLRAFGYFEDQSAISARTIHETAKIIENSDLGIVN